MLSTSCSIGLNDCCKVLLTAFLNSFVFDFQVRQRTSTSISMHIFYQLPVPRLSPKDKWYQPIIERAAKLICTTEEFAELWEEVMKTKWSEKVAAINEMERNILRAELDGIIAHIYGLTEEEFTYILSTFPIVPLPQKAAALDCYKSLTSQFEEDDVAVKAVTDLIEKGECPTIEFKSTLRVDLKTEKPEKYIEHSVIKTLAAFLNSEGGTLLIGVEDNKNVIGLEPDFISFSKPNKLDEFQKHFDNLISKTIGNRFHHYLKIDFIKIDGKMICSITIKEKSLEPVYITNEAGQEIFYIRRQASTIDLKPSETVKYIQEHWRQKAVAQEENLNVNSLAMFESRDSFHKGFIDILSQSDSAYFKEIKDHWNAYSLLNDKPFLSKLIVDNLSKSIDYGLLHFMSDYVSRHLYNDKDAKYLYNQPHVYMHNHEEEGYDMPAYYHIRFIGILYATAILNKIDIDNVSSGFKNMQSIFSGMIEGMLNNLRDNEVDNEKEFPTNYHWLIGQIFSITGNWLDTFNDPDNFVETSSYVDFIPFNIRLCLSELYKGVEKGKISKKFVISQCYYGVINHYFSPLLNNSLRESIEKNIIANIPNEFVKPILEFSLDEAYAIRFDQFCKGDFRLINLNEKKILNRLRSFLISSKKINL
jgi:Holliday junction resolvase